MKEIEIKKILIEHLIKDSSNIINAEFRFNFGTRRADIICLSNDILTAFEIKGAGDNTARLEEQIHNYKKYFDQCYIVCERSNLEMISKKTPKSVGIFVIDNQNLTPYRKSRIVKKHDKIALASTIDIRTLRKEISDRRIKSKHELCEFIATKRKLEYIKKLSRQDLLLKIKPAYNLFLSELGSQIHSDDILILSRMSPTQLI
ncbi:sce7726 family protein [Enterobacter bugandensis]